MLAVFEKSSGKPPKELSLPFVGRNCLNSSPEEIAEFFRSWKSDCTSYNLSNGNFLALSHQDENPALPRYWTQISYASIYESEVVIFPRNFWLLVVLDLSVVK